MHFVKNQKHPVVIFNVLLKTDKYRKNYNKRSGVYFNSWPSGEKWWVIIRGYIPGSCETQEIAFPSNA